jgi:hypothetical protein
MTTQDTNMRFQTISEAVNSKARHYFYWNEDDATRDLTRNAASHIWVLCHSQDNLEIWCDLYQGWMVLLDTQTVRVLGKSKSGIIVTDDVIVTDQHTHGTDAWIYYRATKTLDILRTVERNLERAIDDVMPDDIMPTVYAAIDPETLIDTLVNRIRAKYEAAGARYDAK